MNKQTLLMTGLAAALAFTGCGNSDDDETATPSGDGSVMVTFRVDTSTMADGSNALATVEAGEYVYIVGDFEGGCDYDNDPNSTCWKPQAASRVMTSEGSGIWAVTIALMPGTELSYKYVKTTSDPVNNGWGNGVKEYVPTSEQACPNFAEATGGLWEIQNLGYTVPTAAATVDTYTVDAWRDYATENFGYPSCD